MQIDLFLYSVNIGPLGIREGLFIQLTTKKSQYFAEASPLPRFSKESLQDVIQQAKELLLKEPCTIQYLEVALHKATSPSLQFALESLLEQIKQPLLEREQIQVQGIRFHEEAISKEALMQFSTWKIKIRSAHEWLLLAPTFAAAKNIRLDANQGLKLSDLAVLKSCQAQVEYIEEPGEEFYREWLEDPESSNYPLNFALDESLRKELPKLPSFALHKSCIAYICKPTMMGKYTQYKHLITQANALDKKFVISSSIESPVGLYQLARLQKKFPCKTPWGLGTYRYFPEDFCNPMPKVLEKGIVEFAPIISLNEKYLQKVC